MHTGGDSSGQKGEHGSNGYAMACEKVSGLYCTLISIFLSHKLPFPARPRPHNIPITVTVSMDICILSTLRLFHIYVSAPLQSPPTLLSYFRSHYICI